MLLEVEHLDQRCIKKLVDGEVLAVRLKGFLPDPNEMRGDSYGIDPALLGLPILEVRPQPSDFIMFNSRRMHSVTPGIANPRLSLSFLSVTAAMPLP